jgi:hypothetical protein
MRLDGVEIKFSLSDRQVAKALKALKLVGDGEPRRVGFLEDTTVGAELPLFHQGIVLRVRQVEDGDDDTTVKLRPCRRSQLAQGWLGAEKGDGWKLRVEEDWAGARRVLAVSCVANLPSGRIAAAWDNKEPKEPVGRLFNGGQWRFLLDCAGTPVNLDALTLLQPVTAARWGDVRIKGVQGAEDVEDVVVERWTVEPALDFLELSLKKDTVEEAQAAQKGLERAMNALRLERDDEHASKTERVLAHLVSLEP